MPLVSGRWRSTTRPSYAKASSRSFALAASADCATAKPALSRDSQSVSLRSASSSTISTEGWRAFVIAVVPGRQRAETATRTTLKSSNVREGAAIRAFQRISDRLALSISRHQAVGKEAEGRGQTEGQTPGQNKGPTRGLTPDLTPDLTPVGLKTAGRRPF